MDNHTLELSQAYNSRHARYCSHENYLDVAAERTTQLANQLHCTCYPESAA